ncbi:MAG: hypothetical protein HY443_01005 [Candidatus Nealsonbacteria bacterium]|nr:hypothetical protein [Candidatus Nealsonbacteria bacterium]
MNKGFTLLESLVAIFFLTTGIAGAFILVNQTAVSSQLIESRLEAVYLAQEGIEFVRNARDANFLKIYNGTASDWLEGLRDCQAGCERDYDDSAFTPFSSQYLKVNGGFYGYDSGENTVFKRKIIISEFTELDDPPDGIDDRIKVSVEVSWSERGSPHKIILQDYIYKWWQE